MDSEFLAWVGWRALVVVLVVAVLMAALRWQRWAFDECLDAGLTGTYCTIQYPFGAHQ